MSQIKKEKYHMLLLIYENLELKNKDVKVEWRREVRGGS
jgi:hypothetical protein